MKPAIRVENLSKLYKIGARQHGPYRTLRESLTDLAAAPFRRLLARNGNGHASQGFGVKGQNSEFSNQHSAISDSSAPDSSTVQQFNGSTEQPPTTDHRLPNTDHRSPSPDTIWALKDVSFEVQPGEVVGIIGRNGAGKSTLLKILSRITEPTSGRVELHGRVGSLLEVGTGFHPELTGRENIYMNGSILGMSRREIDRKFDEIVDFAEIEQFLDTPVKRFSSGMYVRLAFAVAAHLDPEILVVDEVLAVGDTHFQQKCIGRMDELRSQGRTVLFVSHTMPAVSALCRKAMLFGGGRLIGSGSVTSIVSQYLANNYRENTTTVWEGSVGNDGVMVTRAVVSDGSRIRFRTDEAVDVELDVEIFEPILGLVLGWDIWSSGNQLLAYTLCDDSLPPPAESFIPGKYRWRLTIPPNTFASGSYEFRLDLGVHNRHRLVPENAVVLSVTFDNVAGIGRRYEGGRTHLIRPDWNWQCLSLLRSLESHSVP